MDALSPHHKSLVTPERKATCQALLLALQPFLQEDKNMAIQNLVMFLRVGMEEGESVSTYAEAAGMLKTVATRHLLDIGPRDRYGDEGLGLITQVRDRKDLRVQRAWVTQKGASMIDTARHALSLLLRS
jgi:DNA-binding MarR family transcriptional regulator